MSIQGGQGRTENLADKGEQADTPVGAKTEKYDPERGRDVTRRVIAYCVVAVFVIEVVGILVMLSAHKIGTSDLEKIGATVISPTVAVLGSVLGFYYGSSKST